MPELTLDGAVRVVDLSAVDPARLEAIDSSLSSLHTSALADETVLAHYVPRVG
jgi:hypothetical protein